MLVSGKLAATLEEAKAKIEQGITSGKAAEVFAKMIKALGGPADLLERPEKHLAAATVIKPVLAMNDGYVGTIDNRALGIAVVALGGGRARAADPVDPSVGLTGLASLGQKVQLGEPLGFVHARTQEAADATARAVNAAYALGSRKPRIGPLIAERIVG
jgi:thymidine phosphorylase